MKFGELKEKCHNYQNGHSTGSIRAYDDLIEEFEKQFPNAKKELKFIKERKEWFIDLYCNLYGMGVDPDKLDEFELKQLYETNPMFGSYIKLTNKRR